MTGAVPDLYFRIRENGAAVFRVDRDNPQRRISLDQIAVVNLKNGEVKPQGQAELNAAEMEAIRNWMEDRSRLMAAREIDNVDRTIDWLNLTASWAQQKASPEELERITDALLIAMHDLRSVLVRKAADRVSGKED